MWANLKLNWVLFPLPQRYSFSHCCLWLLIQGRRRRRRRRLRRPAVIQTVGVIGSSWWGSPGSHTRNPSTSSKHLWVHSASNTVHKYNRGAASCSSSHELHLQEQHQTLSFSSANQQPVVLVFVWQKASQGEMSEFSCKMPRKDVPSPVISGLEPPERVDSIYSLLQDFLPHFKRVYEQQVDIQSPSSLLLSQLKVVPTRGRHLADTVREFHRCHFPNLPVPEHAEGPTALPPAQNIFQQKMYGCVVLRSYKDFLLNVMREMRTLRNKFCRTWRPEMNTFFFWGCSRVSLEGRTKNQSLALWQKTWGGRTGTAEEWSLFMIFSIYFHTYI